MVVVFFFLFLFTVMFNSTQKMGVFFFLSAVPPGGLIGCVGEV